MFWVNIGMLIKAEKHGGLVSTFGTIGDTKVVHLEKKSVMDGIVSYVEIG